MIPIECRITNLLSFQDTQTFVFPEGPGLFFMWGDNQVETQLGSNGAGKTSLWNAICLLFFGKTARGVKAGDVANWAGNKGARVELDLYSSVDHFGMWTVVRTWAPNAYYMLEADGTRHDLSKDESNPITEVLRLNFTSFINSILMPQREPMFLDLPAAAKSALFTEVMGLERWLDFSARASTEAARARDALNAAERELEYAEGALHALRSSDISAQRTQWEEGRKKRLASIEDEYNILLTREASLKERAQKALADAQEARTEYAAAVKAAEAIHEEEVELCPKCRQPVINHEAREKRATVSKRLKALMLRCDEADQRVRQADRDVLAIEKTLDNVEDRAEGVELEVNPFDAVKSAQDEQIADMSDRVEAATRRRNTVSERLFLASGWARWFKDIRLGLIGDALDQLEMEVNNCVVEKGLIGWELQFDVDRETKSGTVQRGFSVTVLSPHNTNPVPWEAWSGGESQRLRIAVQEGLSNLIRAHTGATMPLEVWDEPAQGMTAQGVTDLLNSLKARAHDEQRQIWIVDHLALGYSSFDGSVGVVKDNTGSHFVEATYVLNHAQQLETTPRRRTVHDVVRRVTTTP